MNNKPHSFHIPVMGTGFTIDTALQVARYGISSVISLVDDTLVEQIREFYCQKYHEPYEQITRSDQDFRARRITAYLNLLHRLVGRQVQALQASPFEPDSQITRYYQLLPDCPLKEAYQDMLATDDPDRKAQMQQQLRDRAVPGSIDVNIMTKLDYWTCQQDKRDQPEFSDAMSALRGYAKSDLESSIVFSAGMKPKLYSYTAKFDDFLPDQRGMLKKKIVLKVSDYRSAVIQGKFLAKRGLWVSEFRVESGLNCGGHAFPVKGSLLGPILEEFKNKRYELAESLHTVYSTALTALGRQASDTPHHTSITVQGGIGTALEDQFLLKYYKVDGTGWATPFLLVPEATSVDELHLEKLSAANEQDVYPSDSSPMGITFWNLRTSGSEQARRMRIEQGKPGSACPKGHIRYNTEFTKNLICHASRAYQRLKLEHLEQEGLSDQQLAAVKERVLGKSCICHDLGGSAKLKHGIADHASPAICCGPGIMDFSKIATLEEMVGHIYGRISLLTNHNRPHMLIRELAIYVDCLRKEIEDFSLGLIAKTPQYFDEFKENLISGIEYYRRLAGQFAEEQQKRFLKSLKTLHEAVEGIPVVAPV